MATFILQHCRSLSPNETLPKGQTVLFTAAHVGFVDGVKLLWDAGVDVDAQDKRGWTALMMAAYEGHYSIVDYLVNVCRADINLRDANGKRAFDKAREARIQYLLSSAGIERRIATTFQ